MPFWFTLVVGFLGCDSGESFLGTDESPPLEYESATFAVPTAARDLPAEHRIAAADIATVKTTAVDLFESEWDPQQVMMATQQIEGRVLRRPMRAETPFYINDLYLEGTEAGAPPELDVPDPPWPQRKYLDLLVDKVYTADGAVIDSHKAINIPLAATSLPAGRRIRKSDIAIMPMTPQALDERAFPVFEAMINIDQFVGRTLRKEKSRHKPFLQSDFEESEEVVE